MANFIDDFIPYAYLKVIQDLEGKLARSEELNRDIPDWVKKAHSFSKRYPKVDSLLNGASKRAD